MRAILVAGMLVAAGAAGAQDFGVNLETAKERIAALKPAVKFIECKDGCTFRNDREQITIFLSVASTGAIDQFGVIFGKAAWALAADYTTALQRDLLVPSDQVVDVRRSAERVASGNGDIVSSKYISCETDAGKIGATRFSLTCSRAR
jgi:hypothetical protein